MAIDRVAIKRPQRWDVPFGPDMTEADVDRLLTVPPFSQLDQAKFPASLPLRGILGNDARLVRFQNGDIVVRRGDYGSAAFFILSGAARVVIEQAESPMPPSLLGRHKPQRKSVFRAVAQLWSNHRLPEVRDPSLYQAALSTARRDRGDEVRIFLQDVPAVLDEYRTARLEAGQMFGELAALGRTPRVATVFADGDAVLLEVRWQGLRDIMRRDDGLKQHIDRVFRERALLAFLRSTPLFAHLSLPALTQVADEALLETYGSYNRAGSFKELAAAEAETRLDQEPVIAAEGNYPNGVFMVRSGLVRVSRHVNHGHRTVNYLVPGQTYGLEELAHNWRGPGQVALQNTLRAVGYVNVVVVPTAVVEEHVFRQAAPGTIPLPLAAPAAPRRGEIDTDTLEFLVEKRIINGTATMVIDLNRCTRCDDCVRACAAAHDNNPRFLRNGPTHGHYMVAHACMHCLDPVCTIECPTGAIHRDATSGLVIINDATCIGCTACARNCPYDAIRMVEIQDEHGNRILDQTTDQPIAKATKCDLCHGQRGGPACQRACPHDALIRVDMRDTETLAGWLNR